MTDKEKAVIMAHTGICMLTGEKFSIYHKYIEELMGRPVFTHELANAETVNQIKEKSKEDFLKLCKDEFMPEPCEDCVSRKDAIETAIEAVDDWDGGCNLTRADIIEKAIKSLPSVQPKLTECEDTISRQVVLDKIKEVCFNREKEWVDFRVSYGSHGQRDFIVKFIESLPSIQPKIKTGHWINKKPRWIPSLSMTIHDAYECSNCGEPGVHWWKHCINCGARMIEPQERSGEE